MLLAINANNTNVKFGLFEGGRMVGDWRIRTESGRTADEYMVWLSQLLALAGFDPKAIRETIIATVVPQALFHLRMFCERQLKAPPLVVGEPGASARRVIAAMRARTPAVLTGRFVPDAAAVAALASHRVLAFAGIADADKFFATLRDRAGTKTAEIEIPPGLTIRGLKDRIGRDYPNLKPSLETAVIAVNREYASEEMVLPDNAEVGLFPPVSGG